MAATLQAEQDRVDACHGAYINGAIPGPRAHDPTVARHTPIHPHTKRKPLHIVLCRRYSIESLKV